MRKGDGASVLLGAYYAEQETPLLAGKPPTAVRLVKGKGEFSQPSESVKLCGINAVSGCLVKPGHYTIGATSQPPSDLPARLIT